MLLLLEDRKELSGGRCAHLRFFAQEFLSSHLVSLGAPNTAEIPVSALLPHTRQNRILLGLGHLAPLNFSCTTKMCVLIKVSDALTPFLRICNLYKVCNEIAGVLLSPLVLILYNSVHTGKKNGQLQFYKPRTPCKPHSILVSLRAHLEIFLVILIGEELPQTGQ